MKNALSSGKSGIAYEDLSVAELHELQELVKRFLKGGLDVDELPFESLKNIRQTYMAMRDVYQMLTSSTEQEERITEPPVTKAQVQ